MKVRRDDLWGMGRDGERVFGFEWDAREANHLEGATPPRSVNSVVMRAASWAATGGGAGRVGRSLKNGAYRVSSAREVRELAPRQSESEVAGLRTE
jgi:hypothetical protein